MAFPKPGRHNRRDLEEHQLSPQAKGARDEAFDIAKGVGIVAVVGLHLSSRSASLFYKPFDGAWWVLKWINLFLNFCVPLFLLISAVLLARSLSRSLATLPGGTALRPSRSGRVEESGSANGSVWARYALRRIRSVLLPLLIWSAIFWLLRAYVRHDAAVMRPGFWGDLKGRLMDLAFGKAEFHLYFLSVLAQFCLVLAFLVLLFRRGRTNIWHALLIATLLQGAAFALQKVVRFEWPGATVFWYLSILIPGVWVGMNWPEWPEVRRRTWAAWILLAILGFAVFGYDSALDLEKQATNGTLTNAASSAYALGISFLILALLTLWNGGKLLPPYRRPFWGAAF